MASWEADLRDAVRRVYREQGRRAVLGPAEGPAGPWVAFRSAGEGGLLFESDAGDSRAMPDEEAIEAAAAALGAWGLVEADPLTCFLEGVDRDPADDDPYDPRAVLKALGRARLLRRSLSLVYDGLAGAIELDVSFPNRRTAELSIIAPKPVNSAQARRLGELGLHGGDARWSGRMRASPPAVEAVVPLIWARVRDARLKRPTASHHPAKGAA
ncbi:MAG: hypothetical protein ACTHQQ_13315 [Solirubrobacteraceae bacterium]